MQTEILFNRRLSLITSRKSSDYLNPRIRVIILFHAQISTTQRLRFRRLFGPRRIRRRFPGSVRISGRSATTAADHSYKHSSSNPENDDNPATNGRAADATCTLGAPYVNSDSLSPNPLPGWTTPRRCQLTIDGAGGVFVTIRADVLRCDLSSYDEISSGSAPRVALLGHL